MIYSADLARLQEDGVHTRVFHLITAAEPRQAGPLEAPADHRHLAFVWRPLPVSPEHGSSLKGQYAPLLRSHTAESSRRNVVGGRRGRGGRHIFVPSPPQKALAGPSPLKRTGCV